MALAQASFLPDLPAEETTSPLMAQYLAVKARHDDCLLFFRLGDFYELFFDDAIKASKALDIALTRRGQMQGQDVPMCGVPAHSYEAYLAKLIKSGFRVAICEQKETPEEAKKRGSKSIVTRDVIRIITPGTITEESLLDAKAANHLTCIASVGDDLALAWLDLASGQPRVQNVSAAELGGALARIDASEILVPQRLIERPDLFEIFAPWKDRLAPQPNSRFDSDNARLRLQDIYKVKELAAFGDFTRAEITALGALLDYAALTQKSDLAYLARPQKIGAGADHGDRSRHAAQSGTHAHVVRRTPRQPARHHRPQHDRRGRAFARSAAHRAADGCRGHRTAPRCRRFYGEGDGACAKNCAIICVTRPISNARWRGLLSTVAARAILRLYAMRCGRRKACAARCSASIPQKCPQNLARRPKRSASIMR